jgi:RNA polymerase sigma-70 factor (ECF subfamily)
MHDTPSSERAGAADFNELVAQYEKPIFNVVYRILGDYDEAADVTQETFINAYRSFHRFRGESSVFTWLYQIAVNQSRNRLRKRKRTEAVRTESLDSVGQGADDEVATRDIPDVTQAPHTALERKEMQEKIAAAIAALPPEYREVVVLREMHGMSYQEIVDVTGISMDNVKTRLSRARAMLRRRLEPYVGNG